jgi:hypothetical protein
METEKLQNDIKNQILEKIKSGEVNMKPKYYFILKLVALALTVFLTFILSTMLVSYVIFSIKISGQVFLLGFGAKGLYHFFIALPWFILFLDLVLIFFLDWLLKSFKFGYNSSVMFLFVVTLVSITVLASLINSTSFHRDMMIRAEGRGLPARADGGVDGRQRLTAKDDVHRPLRVLRRGGRSAGLQAREGRVPAPRGRSGVQDPRGH